MLKIETKERGITLIALVVTIIVMLILSGITISAIKGKSGIVSRADESKSQTERKEVIEKARLTISDKVVNNGGNELTRSELKEILEKYFIEVPEDYTMETELTTKSEYGNYKIKISEVYDRGVVLASEEGTSNSVATSPTTSSTGNNGSMSNSGNTSGKTNTSVNNGNATNGGSTSGETNISENSGNTGTGGNVNSTTEIDVTGIEIDKQTATIDINRENTLQLNSKLNPTNANKNTKITWTSKKKTIASISTTGLVTGKKVGNSMIMATSQNGYSAECLVVCQAKITGITVNPVTARIPVGQTIQLTATTSPGTITEKVTWKSRNEDVAKVYNNGNVTAVGKGVVEIIAQNPSGTIMATCTITVTSGENKLMLAYTEEEKNMLDEYFQYFEKNVINGEELSEEENQRIEEIENKMEKMSTIPYLRGTIAREKIESIKFQKGEVPTSGIIEQFDVSENKDGSIIGYYTDKDNNELYELTIISQENIITNEDSSMLFGYQTNLKSIDFENLEFKDVTNMRMMFEGCTNLTSLDLSKFDTSKVTDMKEMFEGCTNLTSIDLSKFDTRRVTDMSMMFMGCTNLINLNLSKFNTEKLKSVYGMFASLENIEIIDVSNFDTSNIKNMGMMFAGCSNLTSLDVSNFNTSNAINMSGMFIGCSNLTSLDVSNFETNQVKDISNMFGMCSKLTTIDVSNFDTSTAINMSGMFAGCSNLTSLDVSNFETNQVTDITSIFSGCSSLISLNVSKFDTSKVTDMTRMFNGCSSLITLDLSGFDTINVTTMYDMFLMCSSLTTIYVSEYNEITNKGWTTKNVTDSSKMFSDATKLVGGNGTTYDSNNADATYARIDKEGEPGYFTLKTIKTYGIKLKLTANSHLTTSNETPMLFSVVRNKKWRKNI